MSRGTRAELPAFGTITADGNVCPVAASRGRDRHRQKGPWVASALAATGHDLAQLRASGRIWPRIPFAGGHPSFLLRRPVPSRRWRQPRVAPGQPDYPGEPLVARRAHRMGWGRFRQQNGFRREPCWRLATNKPPQPAAPMAIAPTLLVLSYPLRKTSPADCGAGAAGPEEKQKNRWIGDPLRPASANWASG